MWRNVTDMKETFTMLEKHVNNMGLEINENKTKYLNAGKNQKELNGTNLKTNINIMNNFVYLWSMVNINNNLREEINKRILLGSQNCYGQLKVNSTKH